MTDEIRATLDRIEVMNRLRRFLSEDAILLDGDALKAGLERYEMLDAHRQAARQYLIGLIDTYFGRTP